MNKKKYNPLRKRFLRELRGEFGKYAVIFVLLVFTIGLISGFLVADRSMIIAYNDSFEKYNMEDGNFRTDEEISKSNRRDIEKSLGIKAYDIYGLTESSGPGVAFECSEQKGMHINEDHFIAEIIDPDTGEVLPDGEKGELVFTSLDKEAFPLLR